MYAVDMTIGDPIKSLGCEYFQLDVTSTDSIAKFKEQFGDQPLDLLLNIAGIMIKPDQDALTNATLHSFNISFAVNASGVFLLTQALIPNVLAADKAKIGIMSSRVGSMADNTSGSLYAYRSSKAAVNSIGVSLANDLREKGVTVILMHPGINSTNLGGIMSGVEGAFAPKDTAERLFNVLNEKTIDDSGKFFQYEGKELPW